jgi:4-oxalomesaconate hydratase
VSATPPALLVVSAHAADFCSRSGGAVALHTRAGGSAHVVALTFGERGESEGYWAGAGARSLAGAKETRAREAEEAAALLGAGIEFLNYDDYPLLMDGPRLEALARIIRQRQPGLIVTHWKSDPYNVDHEAAAAAVLRAATMAAIPGFDGGAGAAHYAPHAFAFEPTVPRNDLTGFVPDTYVDIGPVFEQKVAAMRLLRSQPKLVPWYTRWAEYRGMQAAQWAGRPVQYAEAFQRYSAWVADRLPGPAG